MFVGREQELNFLNKEYNKKKGSFVVMYGRRRVGKTETLRQFCKNKNHIFYSCQETTDKMQLERFSEMVLDKDLPAKKYIQTFSDWEQLFSSFTDIVSNEKLVVVIDEFPYMCKGNDSIPSILQNLWDLKWKNSNIMLILCGSAMSFIEKELLGEKNPLYGRATGIYKMEPMGFYDACRFFPNYSNYDKVLLYSVLGGIPHYLIQFDPELSLDDNIKQYILTKGTALYSEVEFLLHQELREISVYNSIIEAVALGNTTLNDISQKALMEQTSKTSIYLKNLIELGIIKREFSVDTKIKELANQSRGIYKLTDPFFSFWYSFVFKNRSSLEMGDVEGVYQYVVKPALNEYASFIFEDICCEFISKCQLIGKLPFRYNAMGRWYGKVQMVDKDGKKRTKETEIDILAIENSGKKFLAGECKFKKESFDFAEYMDLVRKFDGIEKETDVYYALFSQNGFDDKILQEKKKNKKLLLYDLDDIINIKK